MGAELSSTNSDNHCWQQLLRLLSGRNFDFKPADFDELTRLVDWHHILLDVLPLLRANPESHDFSDAQMQALQSAGMEQRAELLKLKQTQLEVSEQLTKAGIRHLFFKGVALGHWLYGSSTARQCRDIDLIVHPGDHAAASSLLEDSGCRRVVPRPELSASAYRRYQAATKDVSYVHSNGALIELHWALRAFPQAFQFDFDDAYGRHRTEQIDQYAFPVLPDDTHIAYLAAHGCLSHWGRLRWLLDWQQLALKPDVDWQGVIQRCSKREKGYIKHAFALTGMQFGLSTPTEIEALEPVTCSEYILQVQSRSQAAGCYPYWAQRQWLNCLYQGSWAGASAYLLYMIRKALAADTLKASF